MSKRSVRLFFFGAIWCLLSLPLFTMAQTTGVTDVSITIGSCTALDGPARKLGLQVITGASAYFDLVNASGGVNGRKIKLVMGDDSLDPEKAAACFSRLQSDHVFAAGFFVGTLTGVKYVELADANKVPVLGFFSGADPLYHPAHRYAFHVRASYEEEAKEVLENLWKLGIKKIGVIYPSGQMNALDFVRAAVGKDGPPLTAVAEYKRTTAEVEPAVESMQKANPEAVLVIGAYASVAEVIKRSHKRGWRPIFVAVSFVGVDELIASAGDDAEGTIVTQVVPPYYLTEIPTVALYHKTLNKYYAGTQPGFISLEGFIDAMVLVEGLKRAGADLTREKFIHGLESIRDLDLGLGPKFRASYSATNHKASKAVYLTVVKGGTPVLFSDLGQAKVHK